MKIYYAACAHPLRWNRGASGNKNQERAAFEFATAEAVNWGTLGEPHLFYAKTRI